jgi:hypothetical protein
MFGFHRPQKPQEAVGMRLPIKRALLCLAFLALFAYAQQPDHVMAQAENGASSSNDAQATVHIYRYKQFVGSAISPSVYCDETELARMDNGKFFVAKLSPGKHVFRSNDKQAGVDADLKGGQDYYIRVELATGVMKGHGRLVLVAPEQGSYEIRNLKPLGANKVKDTQHVVATSFETK